MTEKSTDAGRIVSLDQFRGYTVLGMFLVNFVGGYLVIKKHFPLLVHHHTYLSYADTIMPQFFFAVGFAYRLTLMRRLQSQAPRVAYLHVVRRNLGLILLGFVVYHLSGSVSNWVELEKMSRLDWLATCKRGPMQTLVHIGITSLWVMPVIAARPLVRVAFAAASGLLHVYLSYGLSGPPFHLDWSNYVWVNADPKGIDGGPLGFLTWTIPLIVGSLTYDALSTQRLWSAICGCLFWGSVLMAIGYGLSCLNLLTPPNSVVGEDWTAYLIEPPFTPPSRPVNMWTMSQRSGSVTYLTFAAGFSLALYAFFVIACDLGQLRLGMLSTLGANALAGYIIHRMVDDFVSPFVPKDAPLWYVAAALFLFLAICYLFLRHLEKHRLYLRL